LRERLQSQIEESIQLKKKITEVEKQLERIEERFILDEIKAPLYKKSIRISTMHRSEI
jgi:hypothetical protein